MTGFETFIFTIVVFFVPFLFLLAFVAPKSLAKTFKIKKGFKRWHVFLAFASYLAVGFLGLIIMALSDPPDTLPKEKPFEPIVAGASTVVPTITEDVVIAEAITPTSSTPTPTVAHTTPTTAPVPTAAHVPTTAYVAPTSSYVAPTAYIAPTTAYIPPTTAPVPTPIVSGCGYPCDGPDLDCADFSTHAEAQAFFDCCGFTVTYDPMGLDGARVDDDGIACESLP